MSSGEPPAYGSTTPGTKGFSASDAIGYGWKKIQENVGQLLLAILVFFVATIIVSWISVLATGSRGFEDQPFSIGDSVYVMITSFVEFVVTGAVIRGGLDVVEGQRFNFFGAFKRTSVVNVILTSLLVAVLTGIGYGLLWFPGVLVTFFTGFALFFAVDKGTNPIDSVMSSFTLVKDNVGNTFTLALLSTVVVIAGLIALCIGVFVAIPVLVVAWAYAYKKFLREPVAP